MDSDHASGVNPGEDHAEFLNQLKLFKDNSLSVEEVECALDHVYKVYEEHPTSRNIMSNADIVLFIVTLLGNNSKTMGSRLRSKALMILLNMAKDEESRKIMLERGITRLAVRSLLGSSEKEREYAVKLLLEFCSDEDCCMRIASEKGALVLLSSMAGNLEYPSLSNLAEEVLRQMEKVDDNVQCLAAAGRLEPLLLRLRDGSDGVKMEMASLVGRMTLTNSSKEQIARQSARIFVELLSNPEGRGPSLQALYNLSRLDDNATILVESSVLPSLIEVLFDEQDSSYELKSLAASTIANIVSKPGNWELASADKNGNPMQSENIVFRLLGLLNCLPSQCQVDVLRILCGIASSPQASELVATHIMSGGGFGMVTPFLQHPEVENIVFRLLGLLNCLPSQCQVDVLRILCGIASSPQTSELVATHIMSGGGFGMVTPFLQHPEVEHRVLAFKLTRLLSEWFSQDIANELRLSNKLSILKEKLLDNQSTKDERSDAAQILANLSLSEDEMETLFGVEFVRWIVDTLKNQRRVSSARFSHTASGMQEGLLGLLLHFTRDLDQQTLNVVRENHLMAILCEQLDYNSNPKVKQLAAVGLKNLSEFGRSVIAKDSELQSPNGFCSFLVLMCGRASSQPSTCPIHNSPCEEDSQLCLLKSNCIKPLVDILNENDTNVQLAAVEALSTLVLDYTSPSFKRAVDELEQLGVVDSLITLLTNVRSEELQEKTIWILEKILRVDNLSHRHALNQSLVRGLVEAFTHGNTNTKKHAQDALILLKELSAVSGKTSSQPQTQR